MYPSAFAFFREVYIKKESFSKTNILWKVTGFSDRIF